MRRECLASVVFSLAAVLLLSTVFMEPVALGAGLGPPHNLGSTVEIKNNGTGQCLEVLGNSIYVGAVVATWPCNGGGNQKWLVRYHPSCLNSSTGQLACSDVIFINLTSGLCIDVPSGNPNAGLQQYTCHYGNNQKFSVGLISGPGGGFVIRSYATTTPMGQAATLLFSSGPNTAVRLTPTLGTTQLYFWNGIPY